MSTQPVIYPARIPRELYVELRDLAAVQRTSAAKVIVEALEKHLQFRKPKTKNDSDPIDAEDGA